jgi:hypothetical protein
MPNAGPILTPDPDQSPLYRIDPKSPTLPPNPLNPLTDGGAFMVAAIAYPPSLPSPPSLIE